MTECSTQRHCTDKYGATTLKQAQSLLVDEEIGVLLPKISSVSQERCHEAIFGEMSFQPSSLMARRSSLTQSDLQTVRTSLFMSSNELEKTFFNSMVILWSQWKSLHDIAKTIANQKYHKFFTNWTCLLKQSNDPWQVRQQNQAEANLIRDLQSYGSGSTWSKDEPDCKCLTRQFSENELCDAQWKELVLWLPKHALAT